MTQQAVPGSLYIIAAPSGGGKTSLVNALIREIDNIKVSVSHTTRPMRPGEKDGVDYHFVDETIFQQMVADNCFVEHANVFGYHYGTSRNWLEQTTAAGTGVILEIDWQGAKQIAAQFPETVSVFILPPSLQALETRLQERAQDEAQTIARRMAQAQDEIRHYDEFDYLIVNDDFEIALQDLMTIVKAVRLRGAYQTVNHAQLLSKLI